MKAVVLAGGYATRMWPITKDRPKMFLPVGDSTVVDRIFRELEADDRVSEVFVSTNEYFEDDFREYLAGHDYEKPTLSIEETAEEDEKFGVVGALAQLVDREGVDDDLLVVAGDNLIGFDLAEFVDYFESKNGSTIAAYDVGSRERAKSYGLVELDGERVVDFQEKPDNPKSTLVSIACYAFTDETVGLLEEYLADDNNPDEPGWFIQWLQQRKPTYAFTFDDAWYDIGTPASYLDTVAWHLDGDNLVAEGATVENSRIGKNVHVMDGAEIVDSHLERTVVFPDVSLHNVDLADSIVDEQARLWDLHLSDSLVGSHALLRGDDE